MPVTPPLSQVPSEPDTVNGGHLRTNSSPPPASLPPPVHVGGGAGSAYRHTPTLSATASGATPTSLGLGGSASNVSQRRPYGATPGHSRQGSQRHSIPGPMTFPATPGGSARPAGGLAASSSGGGVRGLSSGSPVPDDVNSLHVSIDARTRYPGDSVYGGGTDAGGRRGSHDNLVDAADGGGANGDGAPTERDGASAFGGDEAHLSGQRSDPSTAPAGGDAGDGAAMAPIRRRRSSAIPRSAAAALDPAGEETEWTQLTDTMALSWLAVMMLYVCGLLAMGVASWSASVKIPDFADSGSDIITAAPTTLAPTAGSAAAGTTAAPLVARSEDPCGSQIPRTLIAIAFFTVASAVLLGFWLPFFAVAVLPKMRGYRPGVGHVPFTFKSVFTPFVAYSTLVGLFVFTTAAVCLYSLTITRIDNTSYLEDICGSPFVTLRIVGITFLAITFVLLAAYGIHKYILARRAKLANRETQASLYTVRNVAY